MIGDKELNHGVYVLVIILAMSWLVYKCSRTPPVPQNKDCDVDTKQEKKEGMGSGLYYGNTPITYGTPTGVRYIYSDKNKVVIPNSQTAMRRLYDEESCKCQTLDTFNDFEISPSQMFLNKQHEQHKKNIPSSITATRGHSVESV